MYCALQLPAMDAVIYRGITPVSLGIASVEILTY